MAPRQGRLHFPNPRRSGPVLAGGLHLSAGGSRKLEGSEGLYFPFLMQEAVGVKIFLSALPFYFTPMVNRGSQRLGRWGAEDRALGRGQRALQSSEVGVKS